MGGRRLRQVAGAGGGRLGVDFQWYADNIVRIPNRWGIQDVRDKLDRSGKRIGVEYFTPKDFQCHRLVAPHLIAALDELDARGLLYLVKTMESHNPRYEGGGTSPSHHSYGIAFDINQLDYPQLTHGAYDRARQQGQLRDQDERLIAIMQKHGFFYGGDYQYIDGLGRNQYPRVVRRNSDPMHFEFAISDALGSSQAPRPSRPPVEAAGSQALQRVVGQRIRPLHFGRGGTSDGHTPIWSPMTDANPEPDQW